MRIYQLRINANGTAVLWHGTYLDKGAIVKSDDLELDKTDAAWLESVISSYFGENHEED